MHSKHGVDGKQHASKTAWRMVVAVFLTLATSFAPAVSFPDEGLLFLDGTTYQAALTCVVMIALLYRALFKNTFRLSVPVLVFSILLGILMGMGVQFNSVNGSLLLTNVEVNSMPSTDSPFLQSRLVIAALVSGMYVGYCIFFYFVCDFLASLVGKANVSGESSDEVKFLRFPVTLRTCAVVMLVAWLPYIIIYCPTACMSDTSRQLAMFFGIDGLYPTTQYPYAVSLVYGNLYKLGCLVDPSGYLGMALIDVLQIGLCLLVLSVVVVALKELGAHKVLVKGALLFFALFPLVPVYAVSISKDTLHAIFVVLFVVQMLVIVKQRRCGRLLSSNWALVLVGLLVCLTRSNGVALVVVPLLVVAALCRRAKFAADAAAVMALLAVIQLGAFPAMGVVSAGSGEILSAPVQVIGNYVHSGYKLSEQETAEIEDLFGTDVSTVAYYYDPLISDDAKWLLQHEPVDAGRAARVVKLALGFAAKEPIASVSAFFGTTYGAWYPFCTGSHWPESYPYVSLPGNNWASPQWFASVDDLFSVEERTFLPTKMLRFVQLLPGIEFLYAPGTYTWFVLFLLMCAFRFRKGRKMVVATCLPLLMLIAVMVFAPCASLRYAMPMIMSLPVLVYLLLELCESERQQRLPS